MIISNTKKFIFIHIPKTAGTSIHRSLDEYNDLKHSRLFKALERRTGLKIYATTYLGKLRKINDLKGGSHGMLKHVQQLIPQEMYIEYFKFAVVRNPWSYRVSMFNFIKNTQTHPLHNVIQNLSFQEFIEWLVDDNGATGKIKGQTEFIINQNGKFELNYLARLETINQDFPVIFQKIGITAKLSKKNVSTKKDYRTYYNDKTASLIADFSKEDIENFGYNFDGIDTTKKSRFPISQLIE
ncbi:MAG: sulfotransferase family 2 domain-containing protein [Crocosphaera sp.]